MLGWSHKDSGFGSCFSNGERLCEEKRCVEDDSSQYGQRDNKHESEHYVFQEHNEVNRLVLKLHPFGCSWMNV